jgi:hypothetical protein
MGTATWTPRRLDPVNELRASVYRCKTFEGERGEVIA